MRSLFMSFFLANWFFYIFATLCIFNSELCFGSYGVWKENFEVRSKSVSVYTIGSEERVLIGSDNGVLLCLNAKSQFFNPLWECDLGNPIIGVAPSENGFIYCSSIDESKGNSTVFCINKNGNEIWKTDAPFQVWNIVVSKNQKKIFLLSNDYEENRGFVVCINIQGDFLWEKGLPGLDAEFTMGWGMTSDRSGNIFCSTYDGQIVCFGEKGTILWRHTVTNDHSKLKGIGVDSEGNIYCAGKKHLYAFHLNSNKLIEKHGHCLEERVRSIFVDKNDLVYVSCDNGHIYMFEEIFRSGGLFSSDRIEFKVADSFLPNIKEKQLVYQLAVDSDLKAYFGDETFFYCIRFDPK